MLSYRKPSKQPLICNEQPLQLGIDAQGAISINKNPIADLAALEIALKAELAKNPEIGVHLYADQTVVYAKSRRSDGNSTTRGHSKISVRNAGTVTVSWNDIHTD